MLAVRVIVLVEGRELSNCPQCAVDEIVAVRDNAGRAYKPFMPKSRNVRYKLRPELIVERADLQACVVFDEQLPTAVVENDEARGPLQTCSPMVVCPALPAA
jgi:hypothetical protein